MRLDLPFCDQSVSDLHWKDDVCLVVTVYVSKLSPTKPELCAAKAMRFGFYPFPTGNVAKDLVVRAGDCQNLAKFTARWAH